MMRYVLGFAFQGDRLWLIRKRRPTWQAGRLNGIGGKIEKGECSAMAMQREFLEETGVNVPMDDWRGYCRMGEHESDHSWECWVFTTELPPGVEPETTTDESVVHVIRDRLPGNVLPNLRWLVPMAQEDAILASEVAYR